MIRTLKLTVAAAAALTVMSAPTMAADYFAGKQITVQVPSGSGGTYHVYCQLVQRNIARFIPGNPKTVIQNMPGGGGAKSAAYMMNVAPKDGSFIAMAAPGVITTPMVRKVRYDARQFNWLGAPAVGSPYPALGLRSANPLRTAAAPPGPGGLMPDGANRRITITKKTSTRRELTVSSHGDLPLREEGRGGSGTDCGI